MTFFAYPITALAESDAVGTDGKNIVASAVVTATDLDLNTVLMYDDENGTNPNTSKTLDLKGEGNIYFTPGEYLVSVNGGAAKRVTVGGNAPVSYSTASEIQSLRPQKTGQCVLCEERGNAEYSLKESGYVALTGDLTCANGRVFAVKPNRSGQYTLESLGVVGDGVTVTTSAMQSALNTGYNLVSNSKTATYLCGDLAASDGVTLDLKGSTLDARSLSLAGVTGAKFKNGNFIYSGADTGHIWCDMAGADSCEFEKCITTGLPGNALASFSLTSGALNNKILMCEFNDCETSSIGIDGSSDGILPNGNSVIKCRFEGGAFGVRMNNCEDNVIDGNCTIDGTGIELVGLQFAANRNVIINNIAQLTGDNGISISGNHNTVVGNICKENDNAGIWVWGSFNTVTGNVCKNNMQGGGVWAGIGVSANYGGSGQFNVITGNILDDDQAVPTQGNCLRFSGSAYSEWAASQTIDTSGGNVYRYYGLNIYVATNSGTTGATPPTHTSGTVSDGAVSWRYVNYFVTEADSVFNRAYPNSIGRSLSNAVVDTTLRNKYNENTVNYYDGDLRLRPDSGSTAYVRADGPDTDYDLRLSPKGAGRLSFGTVESLSGQTVTGFIRIKDSSGVLRLLAVVS